MSSRYVKFMTPPPTPLVFETFLKLGKLQCKSNLNRNEVLLQMIENFETIQIVSTPAMESSFLCLCFNRFQAIKLLSDNGS